MKFNEKLQELRKQKGITQEELAESLYVSRTAVSKWESGRGYPNIESLKAIAKFFSVTVDDLLSTDQVLIIAQEDNKRKENHFRDLLYGLLDLSIAMLIFLPFFAQRGGTEILDTTLLGLSGVQNWLRISYFVVVIAIALNGILTLALQNCQLKTWLKSKTAISLILSAVAVLLFMISLQPYAAVFTFVLLVIKALTLIKSK